MNDTATESAADGKDVGACWSCHGPVGRVALFCHVCGALQPPDRSDHFRRLGLLAGFDIDEKDLQRRYVAFQQRLHPDRFARKSKKERVLAVSHGGIIDLPAAQLMRQLGIPIAGASFGYGDGVSVTYEKGKPNALEVLRAL